MARMSLEERRARRAIRKGGGDMLAISSSIPEKEIPIFLKKTFNWRPDLPDFILFAHYGALVLRQPVGINTQEGFYRAMKRHLVPLEKNRGGPLSHAKRIYLFLYSGEFFSAYEMSGPKPAPIPWSAEMFTMHELWQISRVLQIKPMTIRNKSVNYRNVLIQEFMAVRG